MRIIAQPLRSIAGPAGGPIGCTVAGQAERRYDVVVIAAGAWTGQLLAASGWPTDAYRTKAIQYALQNDRYSGRIIPLLFKRCEHAKLSWTLSSFQFVLFDKDFDHICRQVLKALGKHPSRSRR